jgi:hypothetical protein
MTPSFLTLDKFIQVQWLEQQQETQKQLLHENSMKEDYPCREYKLSDPCQTFICTYICSNWLRDEESKSEI